MEMCKEGLLPTYCLKEEGNVRSLQIPPWPSLDTHLCHDRQWTSQVHQGGLCSFRHFRNRSLAGAFCASLPSLGPRSGTTPSAGTPLSTSSPLPPCQTPPAPRHPPLSNIDWDHANKRRREQRAHERLYFKEIVAAHAEQRQPQFPTPTYAGCKVLGLKTKWHNSVRSIRNSILRWDIRNYREHSTEWDRVLTTLTRDLEILYSYKPYPLSRSYLSGTISDNRKEWKKFYFETGKQHVNREAACEHAGCSIQRLAALVDERGREGKMSIDERTPCHANANAISLFESLLVFKSEPTIGSIHYRKPSCSNGICRSPGNIPQS
jgi:hypothetical protein